MRARIFLLLVVPLCVAIFAGCEGEQGPAGPTGPAGPPGPSMIVCFGQIDGTQDPAEVESSWPSDVTVSVADVSTGIWDVTLTGTFTGTPGTVLTTMVDSNAARSLTGYITSWSATTITFRVGIWHILNSQFTNGRFSFIVLEKE